MNTVFKTNKTMGKRNLQIKSSVTYKKLSKSYEKFELTIQRGLNLMSMQRAVEKAFVKESTDKVDPGDLTRAAVVLSVAAMDSYFTDIFTELFIPFLKKKGPTQGICEILTEAGMTTKVALELLAMERPYRRIRTIVEQYFERHTTQRVEAIDTLFLAYGLKNFSHNVQKLKRRKKLLRSVGIVVERRNDIAHEGDFNAHRKLNPINYREMRKRIMDIVSYVAGAEELLRKSI